MQPQPKPSESCLDNKPPKARRRQARQGWDAQAGRRAVCGVARLSILGRPRTLIARVGIAEGSLSGDSGGAVRRQLMCSSPH